MASFSQREQRKNPNFSHNNSPFSPTKRAFAGQQSFPGVTLKKQKFTESIAGDQISPILATKNAQKNTFPSLTSFAQTSKENLEQNPSKPISHPQQPTAVITNALKPHPKESVPSNNNVRSPNQIEPKIISNSVKSTPKLFQNYVGKKTTYSSSSRSHSQLTNFQGTKLQISPCEDIDDPQQEISESLKESNPETWEQVLEVVKDLSEADFVDDLDDAQIFNDHLSSNLSQQSVLHSPKHSINNISININNNLHNSKISSKVMGNVNNHNIVNSTSNNNNNNNKAIPRNQIQSTIPINALNNNGNSTINQSPIPQRRSNHLNTQHSQNKFNLNNTISKNNSNSITQSPKPPPETINKNYVTTNNKNQISPKDKTSFITNSEMMTIDCLPLFNNNKKTQTTSNSQLENGDPISLLENTNNTEMSENYQRNEFQNSDQYLDNIPLEAFNFSDTFEEFNNEDNNDLQQIELAEIQHNINNNNIEVIKIQEELSLPHQIKSSTNDTMENRVEISRTSSNPTIEIKDNNNNSANEDSRIGEPGLEEITKKLKDYETSQMISEGEIKYLKERLAHSEDERLHLRKSLVQKEKELIQTSDKLRTDLKFKEREIKDLSNLVKQHNNNNKGPNAAIFMESSLVRNTQQSAKKLRSQIDFKFDDEIQSSPETIENTSQPSGDLYEKKIRAIESILQCTDEGFITLVLTKSLSSNSSDFVRRYQSLEKEKAKLVTHSQTKEEEVRVLSKSLEELKEKYQSQRKKNKSLVVQKKKLDDKLENYEKILHYLKSLIMKQKEQLKTNPHPFGTYSEELVDDHLSCNDNNITTINNSNNGDDRMNETLNVENCSLHTSIGEYDLDEIEDIQEVVNDTRNVHKNRLRHANSSNSKPLSLSEKNSIRRSKSSGDVIANTNNNNNNNNNANNRTNDSSKSKSIEAEDVEMSAETSSEIYDDNKLSDIKCNGDDYNNENTLTDGEKPPVDLYSLSAADETEMDLNSLYGYLFDQPTSKLINSTWSYPKTNTVFQEHTTRKALAVVESFVESLANGSFRSGPNCK